jgi:hypothetical protein
VNPREPVFVTSMVAVTIVLLLYFVPARLQDDLDPAAGQSTLNVAMRAPAVIGAAPPSPTP